MIRLEITGDSVEEFGKKAAGMISMLQAGLNAPLPKGRAKKAEPRPEVIDAEPMDQPRLPLNEPKPEPEVIEAKVEPEPEPTPEPKVTQMEIAQAVKDAVEAAGGGNVGAQKVKAEVFEPLGIVGVKSCPPERYPVFHQRLLEFIAAHKKG
ncbi:hypothetical protein [Rhodoligotrophos defluvii]|uniref:hypothetical protein n=1 Tax=Rhodoligotrophos defluvii TaxID=2561934 RepID=UPI0010CA0324|nr:hypothetical protein [Rhodoligotrophos defluvii]